MSGGDGEGRRVNQEEVVQSEGRIPDRERGGRAGREQRRCLHQASSPRPAPQGSPRRRVPRVVLASFLRCPDTLFPAAPQITRTSTTGPGATMTSSRKAPRPRRLRRRWTCPSCRRPGPPGRLWAAWSTRCRATTRRARRSGSLTSWRTPPGTRPALSPACPGLYTQCRLRSSGPARPSHHCRSTAGRATGTTCLTRRK